ncbi:YafY family protein [Nocardioides sp.]|uniref:helix-turn-helix transcriptional regulator n=1 Tax=Nocardioides sp. TaxID=35761 RepID=UPI00271C265E|nr:WYL domain-containing protein [Nocardioides sp.]MDO9454557.1 WYL domain-containing protein [Nocardioides sp.]
MTEFRADDASPTARALVALELIQDRPGVSGERLGERLGVTSRAARRYVGILRQAGIPVESTPGKHGGYRVGRGFRVPPLMFSTDEALALVMAAVRGRGAVGGDGAVDAALDKIVRVLPAAVAGPAEALRGIGAAQPVLDGPDPRLASDLARAAQDGSRLRLTYRTHPDREAREMLVDPWGVHLRHDRWYLLCWSHSADAKRVLRLDRVEACVRLDERFVPPADLDVVATVDDHMSEGWGRAVVVVVDAALDDVAACLPRSLGRLESLDDRRTRIVGSTDDPGWYAWQLLRVDATFEVEQPAELAEECRRLGRRLLGAAGEEQSPQ